MMPNESESLSYCWICQKCLSMGRVSALKTMNFTSTHSERKLLIINKIFFTRIRPYSWWVDSLPSRLICLHFLDVSPPPHSAAYMGTTHSPKTPGSISSSASKSVGGPNRVRKWRNWHWKDLLYTKTRRRPYDPHICPGKKKDKWARFHSPKAVSWDIPFLFEFRTRLRIWEKNGGASAQKCHAEGGSAAENWGNFLFWKALLVDLNLEKCFFILFFSFPTGFQVIIIVAGSTAPFLLCVWCGGGIPFSQPLPFLPRKKDT